ncbi:hypothetical protein QBC35DRAFT_482097 [Podospora australis]|uniref:Uncharacterized protein n=1 Tax=Podospora australis TaxID=1536484 RepID=A0AAN7AMU5_9PEZI|nr:hypothetical protein QBC35DRAFT_482097 [Podospora australis]
MSSGPQRIHDNRIWKFSIRRHQERYFSRSIVQGLIFVGSGSGLMVQYSRTAYRNGQLALQELESFIRYVVCGGPVLPPVASTPFLLVFAVSDFG